MPFCMNCGKELAEGETCNCTANGTVPPPPAPDPQHQGAPVPPPPPIYNNVVQQPQQKKSLWWIWLIIIPAILIVLMIVGVLAAILVPSMIGYTRKAKTTSANSTANSLYKAANSALCDMDEDGYNIEGYYIISSKSSENYRLPDEHKNYEAFDEDEFYTLVKNYYADSSQSDWFVVVENGSVTYSAASKEDYVGTYPNVATIDGPSYYDSFSSRREKASLNDLYEDALDKVEDKAEYSYNDYYFEDQDQDDYIFY